MASVEYGFRNAIKITDGSAHIMLKTEEIMYYFTSLDEIEFEFSAKWITKKGRAKYILSIDTLILPSLLYINKAKVLVQSEHTSKNMMEEIGFSGRQTHSKADLDFQFKLGSDDSKKESIKGRF